MAEDLFHLGIKAIIINDKNEILVLKTNPKEVKGNTTLPWDLPGGRVKEGNTIEQTLKKEIREELNIGNIEIIKHFYSFVPNVRISAKDYNVGLILFVYICKLDKNSDIKLSSEHNEYKWTTTQEVKELLKTKYPELFLQKLNELT